MVARLCPLPADLRRLAVRQFPCSWRDYIRRTDGVRIDGATIGCRESDILLIWGDLSRFLSSASTVSSHCWRRRPSNWSS